jgi:hypothetical protein
MVEVYDVPEIYYYMDKTEEMIRMIDLINMNYCDSPYYDKFRIRDYQEFVHGAPDPISADPSLD